MRAANALVADTPISYTINLANSGNVKLRAVEVLVSQPAGNSSAGSITCVDASTNTSWPAGSDLPVGGILNCTGSYTFTQDAIEVGDVHPVATVTAANVTVPFTVSLPSISVPNTPSISVILHTASCIKPTQAGGCVFCLSTLGSSVQAACVWLMFALPCCRLSYDMLPFVRY